LPRHSPFQAATPRDFELVASRVTLPWRGYGIVVVVVVVERGVGRRDRVVGRWRWKLAVARKGGGVGLVVRGVEDWTGTMGRRRLLKR